MRSISFRQSRRALLRTFAALGGIALGSVLEANAQDGKPKAVMKKYTKERVGYRDEPYLGRTCSKCILYVGTGDCAIVEGQVSPEGWCLQWMPATVGRSDSPPAA